MVVGIAWNPDLPLFSPRVLFPNDPWIGEDGHVGSKAGGSSSAFTIKTSWIVTVSM